MVVNGFVDVVVGICCRDEDEEEAARVVVNGFVDLVAGICCRDEDVEEAREVGNGVVDVVVANSRDDEEDGVFLRS